MLKLIIDPCTMTSHWLIGQVARSSDWSLTLSSLIGRSPLVDSLISLYLIAVVPRKKKFDPSQKYLSNVFITPLRAMREYLLTPGWVANFHPPSPPHPPTSSHPSIHPPFYAALSNVFITPLRAMREYLLTPGWVANYHPHLLPIHLPTSSPSIHPPTSSPPPYYTTLSNVFITPLRAKREPSIL